MVEGDEGDRGSFAVGPLLRMGAPTTARMVGLRPEGGSTFFRSERKYQRKHAARRLREKGVYCPFCQRDSQRRARHSWRVISCSRARSCARLFPPSKWAGLFPSAAYRRSSPPPLGWGRRSNSAGWATSAWGGRFCKAKGQKGGPNHAGLCREPEGLSPDGGLRTPTNRKPHQTGEPRGLSPSGGNSAAKPLSLEYPRAPRARYGVQGDTPCREPRGPSPDGGLRTPTNRKSHQTSEPGGLSPSGGNSAAKPFSLEYPRAPRARCGVQGVTPCREAFRRTFPKRHTYLYSPARLRRAVRG